MLLVQFVAESQRVYAKREINTTSNDDNDHDPCVIYILYV